MDDILVWQKRFATKYCGKLDDSILEHILNFSIKGTGGFFFPSSSLTVSLRHFKNNYEKVKNVKDLLHQCKRKIIGKNGLLNNGTFFFIVLIHGPSLLLTEDNNHWSLLYYNFPLHTCFHYDSMGGFNSYKARHIFTFLQILAFIPQTASYVDYPDISLPRQLDDYSCGLFVLLYAFVVIATGKPITVRDASLFNQDCVDSELFRNLILKTTHYLKNKS